MPICTHTTDACGCIFPNCSQPSFIPNLIRLHCSGPAVNHNVWKLSSTLRLADSPGHPREVNGFIGEIHISMRLKQHSCRWACPSSLVLPSGGNNPFNFLFQITKSPPLEEKRYQLPLSQQNATNTLVTGTNSWPQDQGNDLSWEQEDCNQEEGRCPNSILLPICHHPRSRVST